VRQPAELLWTLRVRFRGSQICRRDHGALFAANSAVRGPTTSLFTRCFGARASRDCPQLPIARSLTCRRHKPGGNDGSTDPLLRRHASMANPIRRNSTANASHRATNGQADKPESNTESGFPQRRRSRRADGRNDFTAAFVEVMRLPRKGLRFELSHRIYSPVASQLCVWTIAVAWFTRWTVEAREPVSRQDIH
jgi:hypothetical protein